MYFLPISGLCFHVPVGVRVDRYRMYALWVYIAKRELNMPEIIMKRNNKANRTEHQNLAQLF